MKPCEILMCTTVTVFQVGLTIIIQLKFKTFKVGIPILNSISLTDFCRSGLAPAARRHSTTFWWPL